MTVRRCKILLTIPIIATLVYLSTYASDFTIWSARSAEVRLQQDVNLSANKPSTNDDTNITLPSIDTPIDRIDTLLDRVKTLDRSDAKDVTNDRSQQAPQKSPIQQAIAASSETTDSHTQTLLGVYGSQTTGVYPGDAPALGGGSPGQDEGRGSIDQTEQVAAETRQQQQRKLEEAGDNHPPSSTAAPTTIPPSVGVPTSYPDQQLYAETAQSSEAGNTAVTRPNGAKNTAKKQPFNAKTQSFEAKTQQFKAKTMPYDVENAVINQPLEAEGTAKTQSFEAKTMPYDVENVAKTQSFDVENTISEPQVKPAEVRNQFDEVLPTTRTTSTNVVYPINKPDVDLTGTDNISNESTSREMEDTQNRTNEIAISVPKENPLEIISVAKETPVKMDLKNASDSFMQVELEANSNLNNNYDKKVASLEEKCPETLSIGNQVEDQSKCALYSRDKDNFHICEDSTLYYNHEIFASLGRCKQKRHPDICSFVNSTRSDARSRLELSCRANACENNTLSIGVMDSQTGKVSYMRARSLRALQQSLMENQMVIKDHSAEFLFLLCQKHHSKRKIHQLLLFPPFVSTQSEQKRRDIIINVVVIDSVSRPHFYRLLEKTVATMKSINEASSRAQVLDFKYFQSLASFTYVNVQAFFTGKIGENDLKNRQYTFEDLFGPFKQAGYQTLVQEDTCWFDRWGTVLTGNRKVNGIDHNTLWQEVMNVSDYRGVDSFGITHMSCDVFDKSKTASLYNTKKMICLNGRPLSAYFFDYLKAHMRGIETTEGARPLISYTHIDFAHESSGIRLKAVDADLADFVRFSSEQEDTLTVLWSDHGGKTTRYSIEKLTGRFEIYDPFMFMIVPNKVSKMIGQEKIDGLRANQNSLCTVVDLRNTLLGLLPNAEQQDDDDLTSSKIASREDCHGFPMRQYGFCKCMNNMEVMDLQENSNAEFLTWLADYAVGKINNRISENQPNVTSRCVRISAIKIRNVIKKKTAKQEEVYTFDVVAASPRGVKNREVFSFQVLYNRAREVGRDMLAPAHWQRVSIYNYYQRCKDARVPLEMCACRRGQAHTLTQDYITRYKQFGHRGDITPALDGVACLLQIRRQTGNVVSFELANMCQQVLIVGYLQSKVLYGWEVAESMPKQVTIAPYKMTYLTSFLKVAHTEEYVQLNFWKVG